MAQQLSDPQPLDLGTLQGQLRELWDRQDFEGVERLAREGLARFPRQEGVRTAYAHALLGQGHFRDGFRENELRGQRLASPARQLPFPEWEGPIAGRSIVVWGEQGIGDELMMARFIPALRHLGAAYITLACWPQSVRALKQSGADHVMGRFGALEVRKHDCWVSALSLPYRLGVTLPDVNGAPYLLAEPRGPGGIGLVERGRPDHPHDNERSIPEGLLQAAIPQGRLMAPDGDVYDALCRLAALDLLVTTDTSWAHMAGAIGLRCWLLLPHRGLDWRWMRYRANSPWYRSLRLIRQETPGDWSHLLEQVTSEIRSL